MLTCDQVTGVLALPPTPRLDAPTAWDESSSVDLDEAARMAERLVTDGVGAIGLCGTTGEGPSLLWTEKIEYFAAVVDTVGGRVPVWCGTTALGTREVVRQMRAVRDLGADGVLVGLPMWQTPTIEMAVAFYRDLAVAVPDLAVMVYANPLMFKFDFPVEFWRAVVHEAPTVVAAKVVDATTEMLEVTAGRVNLMAGEVWGVGARFRAAPETLTALWATSAAMGPEPWVTLLDSLNAGDHRTASEAMADIESVPFELPSFADFAKYNLQFECARVQRAGYMRCGPPRPPYYELPDAWRAAAVANADAWTAMLARRSGARS